MDFLSVGTNFGILERRSRTYITAACASWHLSYPEYVILRHLYGHDGICQDEVASRIAADKGQVARNVKTLETKGYVVRKQDDTDKRFKHVYLTEKGEQLRQPLQQILDRWISCLTKDMDEDLIAMTIKGMKMAADNAAQVDIDVVCSERGKK